MKMCCFLACGVIFVVLVYVIFRVENIGLCDIFGPRLSSERSE